MIKILIVDDSETEALLIRRMIEPELDMSIVGWARNGQEAVDLTERLKPDLITMDIQMPVLNGLEATRIIMSSCPTPIVVISSTISDESVQETFPILEAGALSALAKPTNVFSSDFETTRKHIIETLRNMAEIKVAKRRLKKDASYEGNSGNRKFAETTSAVYEVVAIGVSVGGPPALKKIFSELPADFPVPIVVVQHMNAGFISGYAKWLSTHTTLIVKEAVNLENLVRGTIYIAPDNLHLEVDRIFGKLHAKLVKGSLVDGFCPSITMLLQSVARICGKHAIGMLLTGMGRDGAQGLLEIKNNRGLTLIQDRESAVVFGMAGVAQSLGAVDKVVELDKIASYLIKTFF